MKTRISRLATNLIKLRTIVGHIVLPTDLPDYIVQLSVDPLSISFYINSAPNQHGREALLSLAGELFGRENWVRELNYDNTRFNWVMNYEGVYIKLHDAEPVPLPDDKTPVKPTDFPILLRDVQPPEPVAPDEQI